MIRTLLLDRDGTLIHEYRAPLLDPSRVRIYRSVAAALRGHDQQLICISNQSIVGRGLASRATVDAVNERIRERYLQLGVTLQAFLYCSHAPWDQCECRKPLPGLFFRAASEHGVDLKSSLTVGNRLIDAEASAAAGCAGTILLQNPALFLESADRVLPPQTVIIEVAALASVLQDMLQGKVP